MPIEIDVERFCILASKVGGHRQARCPQCNALKAAVIEVNNLTLDSIAELLQSVAEKDGAILNPKKAIDAIIGLKTPT